MKYTLGHIFRQDGKINYFTAWGRREQLLQGLFEKKGSRYALCAGIAFDEACKEVARRYKNRPEGGTEAARQALKEQRERLEMHGLYSLAKICKMAGLSHQYLARTNKVAVLDGLFTKDLRGWKVAPGHTLETALAELLQRRQDRIKNGGGRASKPNRKPKATACPPSDSAPEQAKPSTPAQVEQVPPALNPRVKQVQVTGYMVEPEPIIVTSPHDLVREMWRLADLVYSNVGVVTIQVDGITYSAEGER